MSITKILRIIKKNYPIVIVVLALLLVAVVTLAKVFAPTPKYVYVKVRLGQGLWWAGTLKPNIWFTDSLKKGEKELNIQGEPTSEILEVRYYPYKSESSKETLYNVFLAVKLAVNVSRKTEVINYSKYPIIVGAPIERSSASGTSLL